MKLCVAEKPSVAKEIAKIVGANTRKDGYFEGNGYFVSWTFGHLCTLKAPNDYTELWAQWRYETLPIIPKRFGIKLKDNKGIEKQFNTIASLCKESEEVINCGDAGIEGELIQRWVLTKAKCKKPIKRLWISSLTDEAIKEGFKNLKEGSDYDLLYAAGNARAIGDWLLGINATRIYTLKYANHKGVLSVGRVQTPTLSLIVERYLEIKNFQSEKYWEIKTNYRDTIFSSTKGKYHKKEEAEEVINKIKDSDFEIISFDKKKGKEAPPRLFDLTSLQVECNKKFSFSADDTLQYIQKLYEKKLVTYPRVDTTYLPDDLYPKISGILSKMTPYKRFIDPLLEKAIKKSKKVFDNKKITDHHAIIPTGEAVSAGLPLEEKKIYDLIAKRFIAAFYPDCKISNTTVLGEANKVEFKATGKMILEEGWRVLYPQKENKDKGEEDLMPTFEKGEKGPHKPDFLEKDTTPPKQYTEASLLRAMETAGKNVDDDELREAMKENGIGRPSTRANIIETLFKRHYIVRLRKSLIPTQTGIGLIETINNDLLKSVELTGQWERKLRQIENGEYDASIFVNEMKEMLRELVFEVKYEKPKVIEIKKEEEKKARKRKKKEDKPGQTKKKEELICPKCNKGKMIKGNKAYGCSEYKNGCDFVISFENLKQSYDSDVLTVGILKKISGDN